MHCIKPLSPSSEGVKSGGYLGEVAAQARLFEPWNARNEKYDMKKEEVKNG